MKILDRYASAVHASNLKSDPDTNFSSIDVLGAAGLAARYEPLGVALARMFAGGGTGSVIEELSNICFRRSRTMKMKLTSLQANAVAISVLSWYMYGTCKPCGGTGYHIIPGTPSLGASCSHCRGAGKTPFESQFRQDWQPLARWLHSEIERSQAAAGVAAMKMIAPKLVL